MRPSLLGWRPERRSRRMLQHELERWLAAELENPDSGPQTMAAAPLPSAKTDAALGWICDALQPLLIDLRKRRDLDEAAHTRLEAVLQSVDSAILAVTPDHRRLFANAAAERLFTLAGTSREERLASLQRFSQLPQWIASVAGGEPPVASRLDLPDGRTLQIYVTRLPGLEGEPAGGCVIAGRDITETVKLETARRDFIAAISHELRTPLTSIQGYAELLMQQTDLDAETRNRFLEIMLHNTSRLTRMARDLVTLSSIETGTYPFHFQLLDAASLPKPALEVLQPLAREREVRLELQEVEGARIHADAEALHRVLLNLIENAIVHGGGPGQTVAGFTVYLSGGVEEGGYVFRVRDTGAGIGFQDQSRVFERFYRVEKSHTTLPGVAHGTGLGLALVKHIVREHGGRVELASALGQGSTFSVWLPLAAGEAASLPALTVVSGNGRLA